MTLEFCQGLVVGVCLGFILGLALDRLLHAVVDWYTIYLRHHGQ